LHVRHAGLSPPEGHPALLRWHLQQGRLLLVQCHQSLRLLHCWLLGQQQGLAPELLPPLHALGWCQVLL
jgi:hypothetical protein